VSSCLLEYLMDSRGKIDQEFRLSSLTARSD
jgi:hypothetical protein